MNAQFIQKTPLRIVARLLGILVAATGAWPAPAQTVVWKTNLAEEFREASASGDLVYAGASDGNFRALQTADGAERWAVDFGTKFFTAPAIGGNRVVIGVVKPGESPAMHALDARTGDRLWLHQSSGNDLRHPSANEETVAYCNGPSLYILHADSGSVRSRYDHEPGSLRSVAVGQSIVVAQGANGRVLAFDAQTGTQLWRVSMKTFSRSDPIIHEGTVYTGTLDGELWSIDAATGDVRWKRKMNGGLEGPCVGVGDVVVVSDRRANVYGLDVASGEARWTHNFEYRDENNTQFWSMTVLNGAAVFSARHQGVYALDATTGQTSWKYDVPGRLSLVCTDGKNAYISPMGPGSLVAIAPD